MPTRVTATIARSICAACLRSQSGIEAKQELFLARDRVGKKPLLYAQTANGGLVFASEFMPLLLHPEVSRDIDHEALHYYLTFMCVPAPLTAYRANQKT